MRYLKYTILLILAIGCSSEKQEDPILVAYYDLKDALVETNSNDAALYAMDLSNLASKDPLLKDITVYAGEISVAQDDIDAQRESFERLSEALYDLYTGANPTGATIYRQYCPMAFGNRGAYWLSSEEEIFNPYFGDKMLHCGVVKETIEM